MSKLQYLLGISYCLIPLWAQAQLVQMEPSESAKTKTLTQNEDTKSSQSSNNMSSEHHLIFRQVARAVPIVAISEINDTDIKSTSAVHIQQLLNRAPSVSMQRGSGQESLLAIRSPVLTGAGACGAFLIMEEGIPIRPTGFCNVNQLFETHFEWAQSIQVQAGPGSVYYGSNAVHGMINVGLPEITTEKSQEARFKWRDTADYQLQWQQSNSFSDSGYWLGISLRNEAGWRNDTGLEQHKLSAKYEWSTSVGSDWQTGISVSNLRQETAGYITGEAAYLTETLRRSNENPEAYRDADSLRWWLHWDYQLSDDRRFRISPYVRQSDMTFMMHFLPGTPVESNEQSSFGFQSAVYDSLSDSLELSYGMDYEQSQGELLQVQALPFDGSAFLEATLPVGRHYDYQVDAQLLAAFALLQWQLNPDWSAKIGYRQERLDYDYNNQMRAGRTTEDGTECGFGGCRYSRPADRADRFNEGSWQTQINYQWSAQQQVQISWASAYRAPQATELYRLQRDQVVANLKAVDIRATELAYVWVTDSWQFKALVFDMTKENVIYRDTNAFNRDDGITEHQGFEWQLTGQLTPQWRVALQGTEGHHRYLNNTLISGESIKGNDIDTAPRSFMSAQVQWQLNSHRLELEAQRIGDYFLDIENQYQYPGHLLWNVRWDWQLSNHWQASLQGLNLTDKAYAERADYTVFSGYRYFPGQGRRIQMELRWQH